MKFLPKLFENNRAWAKRIKLEDPQYFERLNVMAQVHAVRQTEVVKAAWRQDRPVVVHGWIYDLREGLLHDLDLN